ncbi:MAG: oxidoreductase [Deltaproteobacteria bacterium RIFOXYA12_FULL_58_15]|nr:MAG: oxidoreductase [Deltaproteobacteria bacterium RIFOXYA12_FULL_58_15]
MAPNDYLLTLMVFVPTLGALSILLIKAIQPFLKRSGREIPVTFWRWLALGFSAVPLLLSVLVLQRDWIPGWVVALVPEWVVAEPGFVPGAGAQFVHHFVWIREFNIEYFMGIDGISVTMVILTALISFISCLAAFGITNKPAGFFVLFLLLETGMMGTFCALDMFLFYVFWEVMLLPMYFLIGIWGGPRKEYAAIKFFLYTMAGSVLMLLAVIALYYTSRPMPGIALALVDGTAAEHTFNLLRLAELGQAGLFAGADPILGVAFTKIVFIGLFIGFAIKVPMFPFHTWLPDAHVEAPTPISVILAGVLLKLGIYGMLRFNWSILPDATKWAAMGVAVFGAINIVYAAFVCMAQKDLKKLIAYSSVSHMGFCLLGMAACTPQAMTGAVFQMWGHGIVAPMLFLIVGVIYDRAHTRDIEGFGGLADRMPEYAGLTGFAFFASLGLPGLIGFIGEAMVFLGAWGAPTTMGTCFRTLVMVSATSVVITAAYYLWTMQRMFLGKFNEKWKDLNFTLTLRERLTLYPLAVFALFFGLFPLPIFELINPAVHLLVRIVVGTPSA